MATSVSGAVTTRRQMHSQVPSGPALKKVLIIGLDGATFDVLDPLMSAGRMPHLAKLIADGTRGILESTKPPITPAAWTTFMTGKGPGKHGVIDFLRYDHKSGKLSFNNYIEIHGRTIWELLSERGFRVGSLNLPMTYPPREVNGFMISGFDTPSVELDFTFPKDLKREILQRYPDYTHEKKWQRRPLGGDRVFTENLEYINQSFRRGVELARFCGDRYGWDVMMVLFKLVDNLQHKTWRYLDPATAHHDPRRAEMTRQCFEHLDHAIGELTKLAAQRDASIMIMSDHGHGSMIGKAQPNLLLKNWGYLKLRQQSRQLRLRTTQILRRLTGRRHAFADSASHSLDRELAIDWDHTQAAVMHAGIYGFCYLNVKGRQPHGIVDPSDYERLRREIRARFLEAAARDAEGRTISIFPEVHTPEELYGCSRDEQPWMPDLLLAPTPGLSVVKKIRGGSPVRWLSPSRIEGTHRVDGVFVASGPGFRVGHEIRAGIADIAPTLLAGLGLPVPADMEGRVLSESFDRKIDIQYEPPRERQVDAAERITLTQDQEAAVAARLNDLGYLE